LKREKFRCFRWLERESDIFAHTTMMTVV
jgi:hypothetical protein